jgi:hypothetical protein
MIHVYDSSKTIKENLWYLKVENSMNNLKGTGFGI